MLPDRLRKGGTLPEANLRSPEATKKVENFRGLKKCWFSYSVCLNGDPKSASEGGDTSGGKSELSRSHQKVENLRGLKKCWFSYSVCINGAPKSASEGGGTSGGKSGVASETILCRGTRMGFLFCFLNFTWEAYMLSYNAASAANPTVPRCSVACIRRMHKWFYLFQTFCIIPRGDPTM